MLTDVKIRKLSPDAGMVCAGAAKGLYYKPSASGHGKWVLRFVSPMTRKRRDMGLGTYPQISLADARKIALTHREALVAGKDPLDVKREVSLTKAAQASEPTFEEAARQVHASIKEGFRNAKHANQWLSTLETHVFPSIGNLKVSSLRASDFAEALRPIWLKNPETASRVKQRCAATMDWCVAKSMIAASPVSVVSKLLPKQPSKGERVQHQPAAPWGELPMLLRKVCRGLSRSPARKALEFLILTAARSGEVRGMRWSEVNFEDKVWAIPASRMKARLQHRIPLSAPAIEILREQQRLALHRELVFPSSRGTELSDMALTKLLRDQEVASSDPERIATAHGFRSSFRDWASENGYPRDLAEKALAHTIKNLTEAAYHRTDLLEQRRPMMAAWAAFVTSSAARDTK